MKNEYLIIKDEHIIKKLEELLWFDETNLDFKIEGKLLVEYIDAKKTISSTKKDSDDYCNTVSELRGFLFAELPHKLKIDELDKCIDDFLFLLRIDKQEASLCFDRFLDAILANIYLLYKENCFKRLTCVLYVIYQIQFCKNIKKESFSDYTFKNNIKALQEEDKNHLIKIFIRENDYDGLIEIIRSYSELDSDKKSEEVPTSDSARAMFGKIVFIMNKYIVRTENGTLKYENLYYFLEKINSSYIGNVLKKQVTGFSDFMELSLLQFALFSGNRDAVLYKKDTLDSFALDEHYSNLLYYYAQFYKSESRKESPNQRRDYLKTAYIFIERAEIAKEANPKDTTVNLSSILLEKSAIIAETEDYLTAYNIMLSVVNDPKNKLEKWYNDSYYHYLIWISAQYLRINSHDDSIKHEAIKNLDKYVNHYFFGLKEFEPIVDFVNNNLFLINNQNVMADIYSNLLIMMGCADLIIQKSRIWDVSKYNVLYYTRAENLRFLLEDEKDEVKYRLPVFHANHMNDPEEGKLLNNILTESVPRPIQTDSESFQREKFTENYVFLKSFFISDKENFNEFLPMWVQYGDDAKGVCVLLNESTFDNAELIRINYLNNEGKCVNNSEIDKLLDDYINAYKEIVTFCDTDLKKYKYDGMKKEFKEEIEDLLEYINSRIMYLFKHESYKHENEARVIIAKTSSDLDDVKTIPGAVPKLFIHSNYQTYIDEIILGSKMEVPDDLVPFIHYHGRKMWSNNDKKRQIIVSNSSIQYR